MLSTVKVLAAALAVRQRTAARLKILEFSWIFNHRITRMTQIRAATPQNKRLCRLNILLPIRAIRDPFVSSLLIIDDQLQRRLFELHAPSQFARPVL